MSYMSCQLLHVTHAYFHIAVICVLFNMRQEAPDILEDMANDSGNVSNLPPTIGYRYVSVPCTGMKHINIKHISYHLM